LNSVGTNALHLYIVCHYSMSTKFIVVIKTSLIWISFWRNVFNYDMQVSTPIDLCVITAVRKSRDLIGDHRDHGQTSSALTHIM